MMVNPQELLNSIKAAADNIKKSEKLAIPVLASKAFKNAQNNPNDQTIRLLANILGKMSQNGKLFITRGEFNDMFNKLATNRTNAFKVFSNELDITEVSDRDIAGQKSDTDIDVYNCADKKISNALSNLWDKEGKPSKFGNINVYDEKLSKQAEMVSLLELSRAGYSPKVVKTVGGNDEYIICDANYETPKGEAHILVPVELSKSGTIIPTTIISKVGIVSLNKENLAQSIKSSAGNSIKIDTNVIMKSLSAFSKLKDLSPFEIRALAAQEAVNNKEIVKEASTNNSFKFDGPYTISNNGIYNEDGGSIKQEQNEESKAFASYLNNGNGIAEFTFGKDIVEKGRNVLVNKISSFGYRPQVSVSSVCKDSIIYAVGCDTRNGPIGFEVVVDVKNKKPMIPSIMAVKDSVFEFTKEGMEKIVENQISDPKMVAVVSPYYELKPSELISTITTAADNLNYQVAEDALMVLSQTASPEMYSKGLAEYMRSIAPNDITKKANNKCKCNKIVKSPNYQEPMCGHLNLPLSKVAQNKEGRCIPKYREAMDDTYEGILFNTSKVLI